jgi:hypothetical protein
VTGVFAAIRDGSVNIALFVHVLGAMLLVGSLLTVAVSFALSGRGGDGATGLRRLTLKAVLLGVLPAYVLMRVGAQWTESAEDLPKEVEDSAWLSIGYITADLGALLVLVSVVVAAIGLRRQRAGGDGAGQSRAVAIICGLLVAVYVVTIWAMSAKPS